MKKQVIIVSALVLASMFALAHKPVPYVITGNDTVVCNHLAYGFRHYLVGSQDGQAKAFKWSDVEKYNINGRLYEKLPEVIEGKLTGKMTFEQVVFAKNGDKIVKKANAEDGTFTYLLFRNKTYMTTLASAAAYKQICEAR